VGWAVGWGGEGDILSLLLNLLITLVILREKRYSVNNRKVRFIHLVSYKVERRGCGLENRKTDDSETRSLKSGDSSLSSDSLSTGIRIRV